jgi:hypothetical protein
VLPLSIARIRARSRRSFLAVLALTLGCGARSGLDGGEVEPPPGECRKTATRQLAVGVGLAALAVDETRVYFSDKAGLWAMPKAGGRPVSLSAPSLISSIVIDGAELYWAGSAVRRLALPSGPVETVIDHPAAGVALDESHLYVTSWSRDPTSLERAQKDGSELTLLLEFEEQDWLPVIHAREGMLYTMPLRGAYDGRVLEVDGQSGAVRELASNFFTHGFEIDEHDVFWTHDRRTAAVSGRNDNVADVRRVSRSGGDVTIIATLNGYAGDLALDETSAYVADHDIALSGFGLYTGRILRIPKQGGAPCVIADFEGFAQAIAVDRTNVYLLVQGKEPDASRVLVASKR